jgi:hypothetical protein
MIRFICPTCDKRLSVVDEKAGKIAVCPACQTRIIVPEAEPPAEPVTSEPPLKRRPTEDDVPTVIPLRRRRAEAEDEEPPRRRRDEPDDDLDDEDRPRRRKKKRRRRRSRTFELSWLPIAFTPYLITMIGLITVAVPLLALSLVVPQIGIIALVMGVCMWLCGRIWFLGVAFSDDTTQGLMCLWCGPYNLVYLCLNFEEAKRPFFLEITGDFIATFALFSSGIMD